MQLLYSTFVLLAVGVGLFYLGYYHTLPKAIELDLKTVGLSKQGASFSALGVLDKLTVVF